MNTRLLVPALVLLLVAAPLAAQIPKVAAEQIECLPKAENGVVYATISPEVGGSVAQLYFRWNVDEDYYYVMMKAVGNGRYWGVPPKPDPENEAVEYYVSVVDPNRQVLSRSESLMAPVYDECEVELTEQQRGEAENLTVGETTFEQIGEEVDGFLCDGIVTRLNPLGILRGDERCRACVIAWWERQGVLIPAATGFVGVPPVITSDSNPEASPSTPVQ